MADYEPQIITQNPIFGVTYLSWAQRPGALIEGFLPSKGVVVIAAAPFTGKTFLGLEITRAITTRTPFLGKYKVSPRKGKVLIVEQDSADWDFRTQYEKITGRKIEFDPELYTGEETDSVALSIRQIPWLSDDALVLDLAHWANKHLMFTGYQTIQDQETGEWDSEPQYVEGFDAIILDSLTAVHGVEENENKEMHNVINRARLLSEKTQSCVIVTHHVNKAAADSDPRNGLTIDRLRGASAIAAAADCIFGLYKKTRFSDEINLMMLKNRAYPEMRDITYYFNELPEEGKVTLTTTSDQPGTMSYRVKFVADYLKSSKEGWIETATLFNLLQEDEKSKGIQSTAKTYQDSVYKVLAALEMEHLIERQRGKVHWIHTDGFPDIVTPTQEGV